MTNALDQPASLSQEARRILADLCQQRVEGEILAGPPEARTVCTSLVFRRLDDDRLEAELPGAEHDPVSLARGDAVELRFVWNDKLFHLPARVERRWIARRGDEARGESVLLHRFGAVERIQRRETYRVSLLDQSPPLITFSGAGAPAGEATGSLIELSETGGRALVSRMEMPLLESADAFRVSFHLEPRQPPFVFNARLARTISSPDDILVVVGLSWLLDDRWSEGRRMRDRVARFIAGRQRRDRSHAR